MRGGYFFLAALFVGCVIFICVMHFQNQTFDFWKPSIVLTKTDRHFKSYWLGDFNKRLHSCVLQPLGQTFAHLLKSFETRGSPDGLEYATHWVPRMLCKSFSEGPRLRKINPPRIERIERIERSGIVHLVNFSGTGQTLSRFSRFYNQPGSTIFLSFFSCFWGTSKAQ